MNVPWADQLDRHLAVAVRDVRGGGEPPDHRHPGEVTRPAGLELVLALGGLLAQVAIAGVVEVAQVVATRIDAVVVVIFGIFDLHLEPHVT